MSTPIILHLHPADGLVMVLESICLSGSPRRQCYCHCHRSCHYYCHRHCYSQLLLLLCYYYCYYYRSN